MKFEIYCDESRPDLFTTKSKEESGYLLIGSLWLPTNQRVFVKEKIKSLKDKYKVGGQLKWQKLSDSRLEFYIELVNLFMSFGKDLRFRCIAVDAKKVNFHLYHFDDKELGFYKYYYQLIHHWILDFNCYRIFCDLKTNRNPKRLEDLRQCLNNSNLSSSINSIQSLPAGESALIQLADFLLGATGARLNETVKSGSAKEKVLIHLENRLGWNLRPTSKVEEKFNIFRIQLQGGW